MYKKEDFLVIYPETIDLEKLVNRNIEKFKNLKLIVPNCILGEVTRRTAYKLQDEIRNKEYKRGHWKKYTIPLHSTSMKKLYGNSYKLGIELLLSKVLFREGYDVEKGLSFSYAFIKREHRNCNYKIVVLDNSSTLAKNIIKRLKNKGSRFKEQHSKNSKKLRYLTKFFDHKKLTIDVKEATKQIEQDFKKEKVRGKYIADLQKVIDIHNGIYRFAHSKTTDGRFHNNFNQLNKSLRKYVKFDNKPLCEIDLKNSVPFFLSSLLSNSINLEVNEITSESLINYTLMFRKNAKSVDIKEIQLFHNLCSSGKIYLALKDEYIKQNASLLVKDFGYQDEDGEHKLHDINYRKLLKGELLQMLFAQNNKYHHVQSVFATIFPTLMNFVRDCKKGNHKPFSHFLFQVESYVMLDLIARGFNKSQRGRVPIFTIHDCIVTTVDNKDLLLSYIENKLKEVFKTPPMLDVEVWE